MATNYTWMTNEGLVVPVAIAWRTGNKVVVRILEDTFDDISGHKSGELVGPLPGKQVRIA